MPYPAGVNRLSELRIDADKDWQKKGIANLKETAQDMEHGAVAFRGIQVMEKLTPDAGAGYNFLRSRGIGLDPEWADVQEIVAYLTGAASRSIKIDLPPFSEPVVSTEVFMQAGAKRSGEESLDTPEPDVSSETAVQAVPGQSGEQGLTVPQPTVSGEAALV